MSKLKDLIKTTRKANPEGSTLRQAISQARQGESVNVVPREINPVMEVPRFEPVEPESAGGLTDVPQSWLDTITPVTPSSRSASRWSGTTPSSRGGNFGETESQGEGYFTQSRQSPLERANNWMQGFTTSAAGGMGNFVGGLLDTVTGRYNSDAADQWLDLVQDSMENRDDESYFERPEVQSRLEKIRDTRNQSIPFVQDIYERSDEAIRKGEEQYAISKVGVDPALSTIMDVGRIGGEMLMDAAFGAVTGGSGTLPMVARSFGGGMYQARAEGADRREAILSGAAQGAVDYATERMFGVALPFARLYGGGSLDDVVQRGIQSAVSRFASTEAGQRALGGGLTVAASALTEGAEEFIADWASWQLPNIIYGGDVASVEETLSNSLYDFMLGSVMGGLGGAVSPSTYNYRLPTGQESAGGVVNSDTTMAIEAPEAPGSVQNTAQNDSIPEATRRAVDLLVSGQEISGNQATRIARDPEALSLLQELTGQEINTDAPISQVRSDIRAVAGTRRDTAPVQTQAQENTQAQREAAPPASQEARPAARQVYDTQRVQRASTALGESGQKALSFAYDGSVDADRYYAGFTAYYEAGLSGRTRDQVGNDYAADLTEAQRFAAYTAGQNDAAASLQREKLAAQFAQTAGEDSGLVYDDFVREAVESGRTVSGEKGSGPAYLTQETAERVNSVAKALGLRVRFVDQVDGGRANAEITGSEVQIEKNNPLPVQFLMGHEVTHRLQELAPEEYRAFREAAAQDEMVQAYVRRYTEGDTGLTYEQALDEAAADYAGRMLEDGELLDQFIGRSQDNRTLLEKIRDAVRTLVRRLTGAEKRAAQTAEGKLSAALKAGARRAETLRERQGDGTMDTTRNSLKEDGEYGRTREETGAEFERRCLEEGYQVLAGADTRYGYRGVRSAGEAARQVQTELERLGVPCFVKEGAVLKNNGTTTVVLKSPQATTLSVGRIAIDNSITLPPKNVAGHEAFHFWKGLDGRESYTETVLENLDFTSEAFQKYQSSISRVMFQGEVDLSNQGQFDQLMEEILAYLSGDIHEGTNEDALRPIFRDFDAVRAAWEQLVEENRGGTTRSRYSLKEDGDHGRTREETRGAFLRRAAGAGYAVYEGKTAGAYGYRRVDRESARENARQIQAEVSNLGIEADIISGPILINRNGETIERPVSHAVTIDRARILVNENSTLPPRNVAGHEAFHLWKTGVGRDAYIETVEDNLDFTSDDFRNYQSAVSYTLFGEEADLNDDRQMARLREELFAYISGDIHEGANEANLRPMFRDFDAVRTAWENLVEENRGGTTRSRYSLKEDRDHGRAREETREEFRRRCLEEGYQFLEKAGVGYGFRRAGQPDDGGTGEQTSRGAQTQQEMTLLGIPSDVIDGPVLRNRNGFTDMREVEQAVTVARSHVFISKNTTLSPRNIAGHEAFHLWKSGTGRDTYIETLEDNLQFSSEAFREYQSDIALTIFGQEADLTSPENTDKLFEELFAYISGDIHEGTNEAALRPMFRDFGAVRAAWEQLVEENRGGTTRSKYSLKEDGDHGRTREETRGAFLRRAAGAGYAVYEGETAAYGFRRAGQPHDGGNHGEITQEAQDTQRELTALGVSADIVDGPILRNRNGVTEERAVTQAVTVDRSHIFISKDTTLSPRNIAGHEAFHLWKSGTGRDSYIEILEDNLLFSSEAFREYQTPIAEAYLGGEADLANDAQMDKMREEIFAYISGDIHEGTNETLLRPMFRDFGAVRAAWENLVEENQSTQARESRKGFSVDRELDREIRQIVKEAREGGRSETEVRRAIRDTMDRALERQKEQQRATQRAARGRRSARELRERIERHVAKLSKNLRKPTDKQHIPEQLRTAVAAMLDAINLESVYTVDPETGKRRKGGEGAPTKRTEAFRALREQYEAILNRPDDYSYMGVLDPNLMDNLAEVIRMRDTPLFEMSLDQLTTVWKTVKGVEASITSANKLLGENRYAGVAELAYGIRESSRGKRAKNNYGGSGLGRITGFGDQLLNTDMMNSLTFLHLFGDGGDALYHELQAARDQKTRIMQETVRLAKQVVGKTNVDKIQKKIHTFQLEGGELKLSTAQLMSLYELNQRQQAQDHIYKGGIRPGPRSSSVSRDKSPGENVAAVLGRMDAPSSVVRVTQADVVNMLSELSEEEIRIADGLQSIMQGYLADEGNRESMKVYGYEKFTEDHYFPISSDPNQVQSKIGDILEGGERRPVSVSEWGSAKSTVTGANNGLLLGDIFDVFAQHAVDMSTYASHLGVLEDVNRVRNFAFRNAEGHRSGTIKEIIQRVAGKGGNAYLDKLLQDISRGTARGGVAGLSRLTANYKAASVGLNLRVALQQPTSYARALAAMSPKYLADPRVLKSGGWKKALKYAPIAQWKDWGNFEINQGRQFQNILFDTDGTMDRLRNRAMTLASVMDSATWGRLWNACELEILDTRPSIQKGSEEFYSAVAQRFTDVVDQTQVVDNVLGRSQFMRSSDNLAKMAASYMGEPTQTYNMLYRAYRDTVQEQDPKKRSQAIKRLGRTAAAVTFSAFMTAVAAALWDGVRDDEDRDEKYWERVLKHIGPNFAQNVNPVGMLPYARDILSIVQGYDVSRMDLEAVTSLFSALQNMQKAVNGEGRYTIRGAALNLAAELSRITGLPLATVKRDAEAIARAVGVETEDWYFQYQVERALNSVFYTGNRGEFYDIAFGALADGELDVYEQITQDLMSSGVKGSTIESAMRSRLKAAQESDPNFSMSQAGQDLIGGRPQYHVEAEEKGSFSADDLSPEARTSYNEQRAGDYREWVDALEKNGGFGKLDDEGKDKLLSAADQLASDIALRDHSQGAFTETDMDQWERWATKGAEYGVDPSEALLFKAAYDMAEGEKDEDGKTISGSKKENALELAADLMPWLTDRELEYLMSNYWTPEDRELKEMKEGKFLG